MNEEYFFCHFAALNEHLEEVRPIFDEFCGRHGFVYVNRKSLGRYPRVRIERAVATKIWFDLSMGCDKNGRPYDHFRRDLPYDLWAGASVVIQDGSKYGTRFGKWFACFSGRPFDQVGGVLLSEMERHLPTLEAWDETYLKANGEKGEIR